MQHSVAKYQLVKRHQRTRNSPSIKSTVEVGLMEMEMERSSATATVRECAGEDDAVMRTKNQAELVGSVEPHRRHRRHAIEWIGFTSAERRRNT